MEYSLLCSRESDILKLISVISQEPRSAPELLLGVFEKLLFTFATI